VCRIVGPGNAYVAAAKLQVVSEVAIDSPAGPSELVVIADDTADAALVAADLAAQAEHGADSAVICITTSRRFAERLVSACGEWSVLRERAQSGSSPQVILIAASIDEAIAIADRIAPEHLAIQAANASAIAERAQNCGAIYCGPFSPPAAGDYVVGSNHVLPTSGSARFFSPLGVYDFVKRTNVIELDAATLATIAPSGIALADFEGLPDHGRSIAVRATATALSEERR
jgi:histidinol dehydrogenase